MYSTNIIFDIVLQTRHSKWFFSINYYETSYKLFRTVYFKSRKKCKKFQNIDVLTTSQEKKLPSGNFKFVPDPEKVGRELIEKYNPEDKVGYIMKVDLVSKNGFPVQNQMAWGIIHTKTHSEKLILF